jgi:hypothetical protein
MAKALLPRQRQFARFVHIGLPQVQAYELSGYKRDRGNACRLTANDSVKTYLQNLEREAMTDHKVTVESIIKELEAARQVAERNNHGGAMVQASMGKAKIAGLLTDKIETTTKPVSQMNMAEVVGALREVMGDKAEDVLRAAGVDIPDSDPKETKREPGYSARISRETRKGNGKPFVPRG